MTGRNLDRWCALWHQVHRRSHWGFETSLVLRWLPDIGHFFEYIFMSCTSDNFFIYSELRSCGRKTLPYSPVPGYLLLDKSHFSLSSFNTTALGRFITGNMVRFVSFKCYIGIVICPFSKSVGKIHDLGWKDFSGFEVSMNFHLLYSEIELIRADQIFINAGQVPGIYGTCPKGKWTCSKIARAGCRWASWRWKVSIPTFVLILFMLIWE